MSSLQIRLTPRSSRNRIEVQPDGLVKMWVMASPTDGQANEAACELLADALGLAKTRVSVSKGHTSRSKTLEVDGLTPEQCRAKLKPQ
jgi:uncharacterized protein